MTSHQIVIKLFEYRQQLLDLIGANLPEYAPLSVEVTNEYSFITFNIKHSAQFFAQFRFELTDEEGKLTTISYRDDVTQNNLKAEIERENWPGWQSAQTIETNFSDEVLQSLQTADSIAALAKNCTHGDDYRPGNFSKVSASDTWIKLEQTNYMNSRSLAHKNDYSLRQLSFTIPLDSSLTSEQSWEKYQIGMMRVEFSDQSSANNRHYGDKIIAALKQLAIYNQ